MKKKEKKVNIGERERGKSEREEKGNIRRRMGVEEVKEKRRNKTLG